eukprot:1184528-Prorocentrum_minimum.AAC.6
MSLSTLTDTGASLALACAAFGGVHVFGGPYLWSFLFLVLFFAQQALHHSQSHCADVTQGSGVNQAERRVWTLVAALSFVVLFIQSIYQVRQHFAPGALALPGRLYPSTRLDLKLGS